MTQRQHIYTRKRRQEKPTSRGGPSGAPMLITVDSCLERAGPVQRGQQTGATQRRTTRRIGLCRLASSCDRPWHALLKNKDEAERRAYSRDLDGGCRALRPLPCPLPCCWGRRMVTRATASWSRSCRTSCRPFRRRGCISEPWTTVLPGS